MSLKYFSHTEQRYFYEWKNFFKVFLNSTLDEKIWPDFYQEICLHPKIYKKLELIFSNKNISNNDIRKYSDFFKELILFCKNKHLINQSILNQEARIYTFLDEISNLLNSNSFKNSYSNDFITKGKSIQEIYIPTFTHSSLTGWDLLYTELVKLNLNLNKFDFYISDNILWSNYLETLKETYSNKTPRERFQDNQNNESFYDYNIDYFLRNIILNDGACYSYYNINDSSSSMEILNSFKHTNLKFLKKSTSDTISIFHEKYSSTQNKFNDSNRKKIQRIRKGNQNIPIHLIELELFLGKIDLKNSKNINETFYKKISDFFYLKNQKDLNDYFDLESLKTHIHKLITSTFSVYGFEYLLAVLKQLLSCIKNNSEDIHFNSFVVQCLLNAFCYNCPKKMEINSIFLLTHPSFKSYFESQTFNEDKINKFRSILTNEIRNHGFNYTSFFKSIYTNIPNLNKKNIKTWINDFS